MTERDRDMLLDAIEVLKDHGAHAVAFFEAALARPENAEAEAWVATLWTPAVRGGLN